MIVYHVVTDRPMTVGQRIVFDETHHSGVYRRVMDKLSVVEDIYAHPDRYVAEELEHHTSVALRELALEEVRQKKYPQFPSRLACLYVSPTYEEAESWGDFFARIGRPTYAIVKIEAKGNCFIGEATRCFDGRTVKEENLALAEQYWDIPQTGDIKHEVREILVDGELEVLETVKVINANIE